MKIKAGKGKYETVGIVAFKGKWRKRSSQRRKGYLRRKGRTFKERVLNTTEL